MNTPHTHDEFDLVGPLRDAVLQILGEPISDDIAASVVIRAKRLNQRTHARRPRLIRRLLVCTALAASALLAVTVFHGLQDHAWAQVQDAVAQRRWLHAKGTSIDNKETVEFWFSAADGILINRCGDQIQFVDLRRQFWDSYNAPGSGAKAVYRSPLSSDNRHGIDAAREMFAALATGDIRAALTVDSQQAIKFTHQDVTIGNRTMQEFHITTLWQGGAVFESTLQVDPTTCLPHSWKYLGPVDDNGNQLGWQCDFDFPDSGPQSIYAAGVPTDVPLVDQIPQGNDQRLLDSVALARKRLDAYYAVVIDSLNTNPRRPIALSCHRIWRKGNKWRVEFCRSPQNNKPLPTDADPAEWWKQHVEQIRSYPESISDGAKVYTFNAVPVNPARPDPLDPNWMEIASFTRSSQPLVPLDDPWPNDYLAEYNARHKIGPIGPSYRVMVHWSPSDGPANSVRIDVVNANVRPGQKSGNRFWIDPQQDYLVVKNGMLNRADDGTDVLQDPAPEVVEVCASPSGRLYPTLVRMPNGAEQMGTNQKSDRYRRFYYDFKASIPDDLFNASK